MKYWEALQRCVAGQFMDVFWVTKSNIAYYQKCVYHLLVFLCLFIKVTFLYGSEVCNFLFSFPGVTAPSGLGSPHYRGFKITLRRTTFGRTPLDEWSTRRRDLYLSTNNPQKRQTSIPPVGFEPTIPASGRPQSHAFDCAVTGNMLYLSDIQSVSRLVVITAGGGFLGLCDQKSSYKHLSDFGRLRSYGHF